MISVTEDNLKSEIIDGKALEKIIITSIRTLKQGNKVWWNKTENWWLTLYATKFARILAKY